MIPFRDILRLGSRGTQPVAVKRGLWHAGFRKGWDTLGGPAVAAEVLGELAVANLKQWQGYWGLDQDGVYGPRSHEILRGSFDDYAEQLYLAPNVQPPANTLQLPVTFVPTHQTEGLPGYPAIDVFGKAGSVVLAPEAGTIDRLSGHDPGEGGRPGGPYGWSVYLTVPSARYFLTHFGSRTVEEGDRVVAGDPLGTVCDAAVAHMDSNLSHIHEGKHAL